jgi:hypothetical protein
VREEPAAAAYTFTHAQLSVYGIAELQTLEQVLRRAREAPGLPLVGEVARRIKLKIGWSSAGHVDDQAFLEAFYEAERAHLEHRLILGSRKESKNG